MSTFYQSKKYLALILAKDLLFCLILIGFFWLIRDIIKFLNYKVELSENAVVLKTGFLTTQTKEILYDNINLIGTKQNLWGKIFNYGTLEVNTGGDEPEIIFEFMDDPQKISNAINNKISNKN